MHNENCPSEKQYFVVNWNCSDKLGFKQRCAAGKCKKKQQNSQLVRAGKEKAWWCVGVRLAALQQDWLMTWRQFARATQSRSSWKLHQHECKGIEDPGPNVDNQGRDQRHGPRPWRWRWKDNEKGIKTAVGPKENIITPGGMRDDVPHGVVLVVHVMACLWAWHLNIIINTTKARGANEVGCCFNDAGRKSSKGQRKTFENRINVAYRAYKMQMYNYIW